jgi:hypothetical protein
MVRLCAFAEDDKGCSSSLHTHGREGRAHQESWSHVRDRSGEQSLRKPRMHRALSAEPESEGLRGTPTPFLVCSVARPLCPVGDPLLCCVMCVYYFLVHVREEYTVLYSIVNTRKYTGAAPSCGAEHRPCVDAVRSQAALARCHLLNLCSTKVWGGGFGSFSSSPRTHGLVPW